MTIDDVKARLARCADGEVFDASSSTRADLRALLDDHARLAAEVDRLRTKVGEPTAIDEARDVAARMPPCRERTALGTALAEVDRLTSERNFYRGERDAHHAIQMERTADVARLTRERADAVACLAEVTRERDEARLACDGCADAEARTGRAHYDDCPVSTLLADRDRLAAEVAEARRAAMGECLAYATSVRERYEPALALSFVVSFCETEAEER